MRNIRALTTREDLQRLLRVHVSAEANGTYVSSTFVISDFEVAHLTDACGVISLTTNRMATVLEEMDWHAQNIEPLPVPSSAVSVVSLDQHRVFG